MGGGASSNVVTKYEAKENEPPSVETEVKLSKLGSRLRAFQHSSSGEIMVLIDHDMNSVKDIVGRIDDWYEVHISAKQTEYMASLKLVTKIESFSSAASTVNNAVETKIAPKTSKELSREKSDTSLMSESLGGQSVLKSRSMTKLPAPSVQNQNAFESTDFQQEKKRFAYIPAFSKFSSTSSESKMDELRSSQEFEGANAGKMTCRVCGKVIYAGKNKAIYEEHANNCLRLNDLKSSFEDINRKLRPVSSGLILIDIFSFL